MGHLKIWGRKSSSNVQAVMWCIAELNLGHERIDAGLKYGQINTAKYLAMNPNGTIPTLQDGALSPIWESSAILRYLANAYGSEGFWPKDPAQNANVDKWTEWAKINIALNFTGPIFWRAVRTKPSQRDPEAIKAAVLNLTKYLRLAEAQLAKHPYLAGDQFTLADIQFGHCLFRYFDIDIDRESFPYIAKYYAALCQRPTYKEHVMVSYDELRAYD